MQAASVFPQTRAPAGSCRSRTLPARRSGKTLTGKRTGIIQKGIESASRACPKTCKRAEIMQKWDKFMSDILESNPDNSPVMAELKEVYRLE